MVKSRGMKPGLIKSEGCILKYKYLRNVVTLRLDKEKCTGCGTCTEVCPHNVLAIKNKKALIRDKDACMECGACAKNCPFSAISVDAGVGCAYAVIRGMLTNSPPNCDCSSTGKSDDPCC